MFHFPGPRVPFPHQAMSFHLNIYTHTHTKKKQTAEVEGKGVCSMASVTHSNEQGGQSPWPNPLLTASTRPTNRIYWDKQYNNRLSRLICSSVLTMTQLWQTFLIHFIANPSEPEHLKPLIPRGLRQEMSSPARKLRSWVRIPLKACIFVCVYCVCVVLCSSGLAPGWSPVQGVLSTV
jgi:hypothetical protein